MFGSRLGRGIVSKQRVLHLHLVSLKNVGTYYGTQHRLEFGLDME